MSYTRAQEALTAAGQKAMDAYALARQVDGKAVALLERFAAMEAYIAGLEDRIAELEADARRAARKAIETPMLAVPPKQTRQRRVAV